MHKSEIRATVYIGHMISAITYHCPLSFSIHQHFSAFHTDTSLLKVIVELYICNIYIYIVLLLMVTWLFTQVLRQAALEPLGSQDSQPQPSKSSESYHKLTVFLPPPRTTRSISTNLMNSAHIVHLCLVNRTASFAAREKLYHTFNYDDSFNHQHRP